MIQDTSAILIDFEESEEQKDQENNFNDNKTYAKKQSTHVDLDLQRKFFEESKDEDVSDFEQEDDFTFL